MSQAAPLVSVVIPCWNAAGLVGEAIESALAQTWPNVEIVVVDDGSTDSSLDVIKSYGDRVRCETGPNRGGSAARNRGLELARGDLIQFLDADDILYPGRLEKMAEAAVAAGPDAFTYADWDYDDPAGRRRRLPGPYDGSDPFCWLLRNNLQTSSPLHWAHTLHAVGGFDESLPRSQEFDLHLRLAQKGVQFRHVPESLHLVRFVEGSVSSRSADVYSGHLTVLERFVAGGGEKALEPVAGKRRDAIAHRLAMDGRLLVRIGAAEAAEPLFRRAREISPAGYREAFGFPLTKAICALAGPVAAERFVQTCLAMRQRFRAR